MPKPDVFYPLDECHSDGNIITSLSSQGPFGYAAEIFYVEGPTGNPSGSVEFQGTSESRITIRPNPYLDIQRSVTILMHLYPTIEIDQQGMALYYTTLKQSTDQEGVNIKVTNDGSNIGTIWYVVSSKSCATNI